MKLSKHILFTAAVAVMFYSCKDKLELNAPYKEIPSIYAVLNPQNSLQIIRVNKVFLGEGDANQMAQIADSVNYPEGELEITLTRKDEFGATAPASKDGKMLIQFRDSVVQTANGAFAKTQRVYVSSDRLLTRGKYTLTVKNKKTGNVFTAQATALDSVNGQQPFLPIGAPYYPYAPVGPPNDNSAQFINYRTGGAVQYIPDEAKYGKFYNLTIRMHFYDSLFDGGKTWRYVDYQFANKSVKDALVQNAFTYMRNDFKADDFFSAIGIGLGKAGLSASGIVGRKMERVEYIISTTGQDYMDYMQYVSPSLSISQTKPLYSNFDGQKALGLFAFRTRCSVSKQLANDFISEFARNRFTCSYNFFTANLSKPGCQ